MAIGAGVWRNWGRNQRCRPLAVSEPRSVLEVVEEVRAARDLGQTVKVVASGHSFTDIACTTGRMLRVNALDRVLDVDADRCTATVEAGIPLWRLNAELAKRGLAISNLGDIDRQTLAGAIATGTHGTSHRFGGIAGFVTALELVTGTGEVVRCSPQEEPDLFACARVGLGALGILTQVTLQCEPLFRLEAIEEPVPFATFLDEWEAAVDGNDHVDSYWFPHTDVCTMKRSNRTDKPIRVKTGYKKWRDEVFWGNYYYGALAAYGRRRPDKVPSLVRGVAESIHRSQKVDVSYGVFCNPRLVRFVEMEYAVPREHMRDALQSIRALVEREHLPVDFPVEIRAVPGDDIPLSMGFGRPTAYLAVHVSSGSPYEPYFHGVEEIMDGFGGRPHWGKLHFQDAASLAPRYPEWERFRSVRARVDPDGVFRNAYTDRVLGLP